VGGPSAVLQRLSTSALGDILLRSPEARFTTNSTPPPVRVVDGPVKAAGNDNPVGALWTSSFLPVGTSM
jgi:hypothetical protein